MIIIESIFFIYITLLAFLFSYFHLLMIDNERKNGKDTKASVLSFLMVCIPFMSYLILYNPFTK